METKSPIQKPFVPPERTEESKPTSEIPEQDLAEVAGGVSGSPITMLAGGVSENPLGISGGVPGGRLDKETHEAGLLGTTEIIKR